MFDMSRLDAVLKNFVNGFRVEANVAGELCLSVPFEHVAKLPQLLNTIDENKAFVGMDTYSVSSSTMEEVFLK